MVSWLMNWDDKMDLGLGETGYFTKRGRFKMVEVGRFPLQFFLAS